jgi:hypothetical protein
VIVVSAGAKAILDIPKTLEALETRGVPVVAFGQDEMPAFWSRDSGLKAPLRLDTPEIARFEATRRALGGHGGMLIANPVPVDDEIPAPEMNRHIAAALAKAGKGHRGQGGHPVPAGRDPRPDRRRKPQDQHRAGAQQCPPRRPDRHGSRFGKVMSLRRARQPTARITL